MADKVQGAISFTPIVEVTADSDSATLTAIHHDIAGSLGGNMTYDFGADDRWYYAPNVIVVNSNKDLIGSVDNDNTDLVGASGSHTDSSEAAGNGVHFTDSASAVVDCGTDDVRFLFIKNTGTSDTSGTTTTNSVYLCIENSTSAHGAEQAIEIAAGESWMGKINNIVADMVIISGAPNAAAVAATVNDSTSVRCTVAAVIDDGGH